MAVPVHESYPELNHSSVDGTMKDVKDSVNFSKSPTQSFSSMDNSHIITTDTQSITQSITDGPMIQKAKTEANKTTAEFNDVANSRRVPDQKTATGQSLTHYHSMFYTILSWKNPRVTAIIYATITTFIFFTRYVPILKYLFKATYIILGIVAAAEIAGTMVFDKGFATQVRPRKYYTIPRGNLEAAVEDMEQFVNFFVIEFQRIVFAENIYATIFAFSSALVGYFLVKFVPKWGIALIATTVVFFVPLVYVRNQELIDQSIHNATDILHEQAQHMKDLAAHHTGRAAESAKSTVNTYTAKAQDLVGHARNRAGSITGSSTTPLTSSSTTSSTTSSSIPATKHTTVSNTADIQAVPLTSTNSVKVNDFPVAPVTAPVTEHTADPGSAFTESSHVQPLASL